MLDIKISKKNYMSCLPKKGFTFFTILLQKYAMMNSYQSLSK